MSALLSHPWLIKAAAFAAAVLMVVLFLAGMRRGAIKVGETRERLRNTERLNRVTERVRNAQREVPRPDRGTVTDRLRNGKF